MAKKHEKNVRKRLHTTDELKKFKRDHSKDTAESPSSLNTGAKIVLFFMPIAVATAMMYFVYLAQLREMVRQPLDKPKITPQNKEDMDMTRYWGSYRSNLYFGFKTRSPQSPVMGLMWMPQFNMGPNKIALRHWCDQNDQLPLYGWFNHDGVNFGVQEIYDTYYTLSTSFAKRPGGEYGGDWTARITANPRPGAEKAIVALFFYMALDGDGHIQADVKRNTNRLDSISGQATALGRFNMHFVEEESANLRHNYYVTYTDNLHTLKENLQDALQRGFLDKAQKEMYVASPGVRLPKDVPINRANFMVHQVTGKLPFTIEILFESESNSVRPNRLSGPVYVQELEQHMASFNAKFENLFQMQKNGMDEGRISFAKTALSNMIGGIGYFHGSSLVKSQYTKDEVLTYWEAPLYTAVPSRSFFPRGFLWDEGFHNLLIHKWDQEISMDIIGHWLDLMNSEGWIPREQILGSEAMARVPSEFVVQHNENANPPTLFLPLQAIVKNLIRSDNPKDIVYLERLFPRLQTWYDWFNTTQSGPKRSTYRWKGRDAHTQRELNPKTLSSGLDDYPRASHPTADEYHLDLRCWMALASSVMADIAKAIGKPWQQYQETYDVLSDNKLLDELHWSEKTNRYSDYGLHTDGVKLERPAPPVPKPGQRPPPPKEKERVVKKEPVYRHVDSMFGYVSLFPFLVKIIDPHSLKLGKVLSDLQDPNLLWTEFGLRSLAKKSPMYNKHNTEHDPPYWRGNIWININYLTLGALYHYSHIEGPYQTPAQAIYSDLRTNLIENMFAQFQATGYIWENYDDVTGQGKGCHPFTGWSALIVAIMAEEY